jgi:hypothetical protein
VSQRPSCINEGGRRSSQYGGIPAAPPATSIGTAKPRPANTRWSVEIHQPRDDADHLPVMWKA